ncbi:hypothetical protein BJ322DRAFT_1078392, partial [Thelephora terrestris]
SELYDVVDSALQNFMDPLERFEFIANGHIYYLNRSQPPLFSHTFDRYIKATNHTSILERALPLAELELEWWSTNRSITVTSSNISQMYNMFHFADYRTVTGVNLSEQQRSDLYAELARGAESGNVSTQLQKDFFLPSITRLGLHWSMAQATSGQSQIKRSRFQAQEAKHQEHHPRLL